MSLAAEKGPSTLVVIAIGAILILLVMAASLALFFNRYRHVERVSEPKPSFTICALGFLDRTRSWTWANAAYEANSPCWMTPRSIGSRFRLALQQIEQHGPGLVLDYRHPGGGQFLAWVD